jgi:hypothetical protein
VHDAIGGFVDASLATPVDGDYAARLLVFRSGEIFRLDADSITRLL